MSQTSLPIHSCENDKNPDIYYKFKINEYEKKRFGNFCFCPGTPDPNLEPNPVPAFNITFMQSFQSFPKDLFNNHFNNLFFQNPEKNNLFCLSDCLFVCLENLAVQPNSNSFILFSQQYFNLMLCPGPINNLCFLLIFINILKYFNVTHLPLFTTPIA